MYQLPDGTQTIMTPHIARMNNLTYSSSLFINVHIIIEIITQIIESILLNIREHFVTSMFS